MFMVDRENGVGRAPCEAPVVLGYVGRHLRPGIDVDDEVIGTTEYGRRQDRD